MRTSRAIANRHSPRSLKRAGNILVMSAVLMVVMAGFLALSIDVGYLYVARTEAQRTADAAALAAAWELVADTAPETGREDVFSRARAKAIEFAAQNRVGHVHPKLDMNLANKTGGDIVIGRLDNPANRAEILSFGEPERYNSVQVRIQRTAARNGSVGLFFARVIGVNSADVTAEATAIYSDNVRGFRPTSATGNAKLLPFALHEDSWTSMMEGAGDDNWSYDPETDTISPGSDGFLEIRLFGGNGAGSAMLRSVDQPEWYVAWQAAHSSEPPVSTQSPTTYEPLALGPGGSWQALLVPQMAVAGNGNSGDNNGNSTGNGSNQVTPGNFGILNLGGQGNDARTVERQIRDGLSSADLEGMGGELALDSVTDSIGVSGTPGMKTSMKSAVEAVTGQDRIVPLYREVLGEGNNTTYTIVGFVGVRIVSSNFQGDDKHIIVQPTMVVEPSAIPNWDDSGGAPTSEFIASPIRLAR